MKNVKKAAMLFLAVSVLAALLASMAFAADAVWPKGRLTLVWHSQAGSGGDLMMRTLAKYIESKTGVTAIVENRTGASGANAWSSVAREKPDGSVILGVSSTFIASPLQNNFPYNYTTLDPIARLFVDTICIFASASSPYETFADFVEDAKKRPGELKMTGGTAGNVEFVAARELMKEAGVNVPIVPFEGGSEGVVAVIGGHVTIGVGEYAEIASAVQGGKLKVLVLFNELPGQEIPTVADLGYKTRVEKFRGIVVTKGTPQEIKDAIFNLLKDAMDDPDFKTYYTNNYLVPAFLNADDFYKAMEKQTEEVKASLEGLK
ncbi:MAG: tripartite tricarboxylate transporter substrate binding protein [Synergistaceae bacterium]|jgi:putative tricarboxylic transport membrane protein|nr:tripartite tricarboxylate transporter substrate binding protein [Synergistaceae bacterium]